MEGSAISHRAGSLAWPLETHSGCLAEREARWGEIFGSFTVEAEQAFLRLTGSALGIIFITCAFDSGTVSY